MTDPLWPNGQPTNGSYPTNGSQPPEDPLPEEIDLADKLPQTPLPDARPIETISPGVQRDARRAFLILMATGLLIGALTATGVVWVMNQFNLIGVPAQQDSP